MSWIFYWMLCITTTWRDHSCLNNFEFIQHNIHHIECFHNKLWKGIFLLVKTTESNTVYAVCCIHVQQQFYQQTKYHKTKDKGRIKSKNIALARLIFLSFSELSIHPFYATGLFLYLLKISENQRFSHFFWRYRKRSVSWHVLEKTSLLVIYVFRFILLLFEILSLGK